MCSLCGRHSLCPLRNRLGVNQFRQIFGSPAETEFPPVAGQSCRAVGAFPDGKSALMLAAARLRHVAGTKWGMRRYLDMNRLAEASEAA